MFELEVASVSSTVVEDIGHAVVFENMESVGDTVVELLAEFVRLYMEWDSTNDKHLQNKSKMKLIASLFNNILLFVLSSVIVVIAKF
jgi:hypothetical protein